MNLDVIDPEIHIAISNEKKRQLENINLIMVRWGQKLRLPVPLLNAQDKEQRLGR